MSNVPSSGTTFKFSLSNVKKKTQGTPTTATTNNEKVESQPQQESVPTTSSTPLNTTTSITSTTTNSTSTTENSTENAKKPNGQIAVLRNVKEKLTHNETTTDTTSPTISTSDEAPASLTPTGSFHVRIPSRRNSIKNVTTTNSTTGATTVIPILSNLPSNNYDPSKSNPASRRALAEGGTPSGVNTPRERSGSIDSTNSNNALPHSPSTSMPQSDALIPPLSKEDIETYYGVVLDEEEEKKLSEKKPVVVDGIPSDFAEQWQRRKQMEEKKKAEELGKPIEEDGDDNHEEEEEEEDSEEVVEEEVVTRFDHYFKNPFFDGLIAKDPQIHVKEEDIERLNQVIRVITTQHDKDFNNYILFQTVEQQFLRKSRRQSTFLSRNALHRASIVSQNTAPTTAPLKSGSSSATSDKSGRQSVLLDRRVNSKSERHISTNSFHQYQQLQQSIQDTEDVVTNVTDDFSTINNKKQHYSIAKCSRSWKQQMKQLTEKASTECNGDLVQYVQQVLSIQKTPTLTDNSYIPLWKSYLDRERILKRMVK